MTSSLSSRVPIAQLEPTLELPNDSAVHGIVTLLWPYASSTQSLSLLLVEPDFRLRRQRGQVRVHFEGSSAKAVARAHVSSGDELVVNLRGASWENDPTVSSTPGRGIEWELIFREFVVLEIHRPGQQATILEIDHPAASPEPSRQTMSPCSSPLYNAHIPDNIHKPFLSSSGDAGNIWSSPTFLKRAHFATTQFDPFAELEDEFLDNKRRKRTKMGRRSEEWKFVERTPSPEREGVEAPLPEPLSSPVETMQTNAGQAVEERATAATPRRDMVVSISEGHSPAGGEDSLAEKGVDMNIETAETIIGGTGTANKTSVSPFHEGPEIEIEQGNNGRDFNEERVIREQDLTSTASNAIRALTRDSNPSEVSSRSQSPAHASDSSQRGTARDSNNEAKLSEVASDFGQDGATVKNPRQAENLSPMASEIGRRWVEMHELANNHYKAKPTLNVSGIERPESSIKETPMKNNVSSQVDTEQEDNEAQKRFERRVSPSEPYIESLEQPGQEVPEKVHYSEVTLDEDPTPGETAKIEDVRAQTPVSPKQRTSEDYVDVNVRTDMDEGNNRDLSQQATTMLREETLIDEKPSDRDIVVKATSQDSMAATNPSIESAPPRPLIIDLESDDESDVQSNLLSAVEDTASHGSADTQYESAQPPADGNGLIKHDGTVLEGESPRTEEVYNGFDAEELGTDPDQLRETIATLEPVNELFPSHGDENIIAPQEKPPVDASQIANNLPPSEPLLDLINCREMDKDGGSFLQLPTGVDPQELAVGAKTIIPHQRLPSTIQDTFESPSTGHILSQINSQDLDLDSQAFTQSISSAHADDPLPTTEPVRLTPAQTVALTPESMARIDGQSSQTQVSEGPAMQMPTDAYEATAGKDLARKRSTEGLVETDVGGVQRSSPEAEYQQGINSQAESHIPASNSVSQESPVSKGSSLIARVKETRRLSSQNSRRRLTGGSASPWFTSRRPSQTILKDEAESEVHASSSERSKEIAVKTSTKSTPEKSEKRLSQSFIRSSPRQSPLSESQISSLPGSQYLPPSQIVAGFRTNLSYFVPLASLHSHFGTDVDVLAVAISSTSVSRAKSGPKDYNQALFIIDPSSVAARDSLGHDSASSLVANASLIIAQIFRPRKACFPVVDVGDAILLRNFKVHTFQKAISLISTDSSAWAVFHKDADVQIHGPPVEYGPEERAFARAQWNWWASLDAQLKDRLLAAAAAAAAVPKAKTDRAKKGLGFELASSSSQSQKSAKPSKSMDDKVLPTPVTEPSLGSGGSPKSKRRKEKDGEVGAQPRRVLRPRNARGQTSASPEQEDIIPMVEEIHELRDGTRYVDRKGVGVQEVEAERGVHELRDGTRYRDRGGER